MKLYDSDLSPNAKRVRVVLKEVGETAEVRTIDFMKGEHKGPEVMKLNPNGKLPTLALDDGTGLWESPAILLHFAWKHPEKNLVPGNDLRARTELAKWMFWNASHLESAIFTTAFEKMIKPLFLKQTPSEANIAAAKTDFDQLAPILNAQLEGKTWVLGSQFTIADICIGTTVDFATNPQLGLDFTPYKHITAWLGRLQARDSWKA